MLGLHHLPPLPPRTHTHPFYTTSSTYHYHYHQQAALELERCIDAIADQLHGPIKAALPPKHWRSKGEVRWVEGEVARREAATKEFGTLCEELLEAETRFSS